MVILQLIIFWFTVELFATWVLKIQMHSTLSIYMFRRLCCYFDLIEYNH
uniref:Uncharacterized protein n=1 Tax=Arundo donax TaxID=35708 RepID=A0A0A8YM98_ARUDO